LLFLFNRDVRFQYSCGQEKTFTGAFSIYNMEVNGNVGFMVLNFVIQRSDKCGG